MWKTVYHKLSIFKTIHYSHLFNDNVFFTIHYQPNRSGFTLIELTLILTIFAILITFTSINLLRPQFSSSFNPTTNTLIADLKEQQIKAMAGDSEGTGSQVQYGIFFEGDKYILFRGPTYIVGNPSNFAIDLASDITITNNLSSSQIVFEINSGEWVAYASSQNTVILQNLSGDQNTIGINRYGSVTIN